MNAFVHRSISHIHPISVLVCIPCSSYFVSFSRTFSQQSIVVSFIVTNIPGLIDVTTQPALEQMTKEYLMAYVADLLEPRQQFVIETVELKSQEAFFTRRELRPQMVVRRRRLNDSAEALRLEVSLTVAGYTVAVDVTLLSRLLVEGVDSEGFQSELRKSDPFYSNAEASSAIRQFPTSGENEPTTQQGSRSTSSTTTTVLSILAAILLMCIAVAIYSFRHKYMGQFLNEDDVGSVDASTNYTVIGSRLVGMFSFDSTSTGIHQQHSHDHQSLDQTVQNDRQFGAEVLPQSSGVARSSLIVKSPSHSSCETATSIEMSSSEEESVVHPLAALIPPMLVIDHIDNQDSPEKERSALPRKEGSGVPMKHAEATATFTNAIKNPTTPTFSQMLL